MANTKNKESMAYQNKLKFIRDYNKKNIKKIYLMVNVNTERDLLEHLEKMPKRATYIKGLIRQDMMKENN